MNSCYLSWNFLGGGEVHMQILSLVWIDVRALPFFLPSPKVVNGLSMISRGEIKKAKIHVV